MLVEVLAIAARIGSQPAGQSALEVSAGLASALGEWDRATRFFGMAEAQAERTGLHRDPADEASAPPLRARAREPAPGATEAEAAGRELRYEDALEEARRWLARGT